ncbi:MAG: peptidoglycan DD-metalloendopeptidase family protein, partial [Fimbriimonadaceae bacterium]|nr:peptidoglycan DD-metalloendopeptidase family protein [Chitinophagales bacterium]
MILILSIRANGQSGKKTADEERFVCNLTDTYYNDHVAPRVKKNIDSLKLIGKIPSTYAKLAEPTVDLAWPLRMTADYASTSGVYSYYRISNFRDLQAGTGMLDWMCNEDEAARTYDGHNGVDIAPKPFMWQTMDDQVVEAIAAADGIIVDFWGDGPFDRNCENPDLGDANFVQILHSDGSITSYWHLKTGSLGNFSLGDSIVTGQFLGKVGSSGNSTNPHLHFGVSIDDGSGSIGVEPWYSETGCNTTVSESLWIDQKPYYDQAIQRISTHDAEPLYKECAEYEAGENEDVYICNHFTEGTTMYINVGIRDYQSYDFVTIDILNSSGTVLESFIDFSDGYDNSADLVFSADLEGYADGQYSIRVNYYGVSYHFFTVGCIDAYSLSGAISGTRGWLAGDNINSTITVSGSSANNIRYEAGDYITLNPGFRVSSNAQFTAKINACTIGGAKTAEETTTSINNIRIYPNPNEGKFEIDLSAFMNINTPLHLKIFDMKGEIIWENKIDIHTDKIHVDVYDLPKGIYSLVINSENSFEVSKVVIQ